MSRSRCSPGRFLPGAACLLRGAGLLLCASVLNTGCGFGERPNVLLIVIDTARADRFTFNGYERDTSPAIAALAAEGAIYENAYTPAPWTLPAHASLFTGLFPSAHGADAGHLLMDDSHTTLAEAFEGAGYDTVGYIASPWISAAHGFHQLHLFARRGVGGRGTVTGLSADHADQGHRQGQYGFTHRNTPFR